MDIRPRTRILKGAFLQSSIIASVFSTFFIGRAILPYPEAEAAYEPMPAEETYEAIQFSNSVSEIGSGGEVLGASAMVSAEPLKISLELDKPPEDERITKLESFLRRKNSPLADYADILIEEADKYGVDHRLPVAISGLESGYCRVTHKPYNCWGFMTAQNWSGYEAAIRTYMERMNKGYFSKGADTPEEIGPIYAADPNWAKRIRGFMADIP